MAFTNKLDIALLLVVMVMINIQPSESKPTEAMLQRICRNTEDYGFCYKTFTAHPIPVNDGIVELTHITVIEGSNHATTTHEFIRETLEKTRDPALKSDLSECENAYRLVMQAFANAALSFIGKDYRDVEKSEQITPRAVDSCIQTLHAPPSHNILDQNNREMRIVSQMAILTVRHLLSSPSSHTTAAPTP